MEKRRRTENAGKEERGARPPQGKGARQRERGAKAKREPRGESRSPTETSDATQIRRIARGKQDSDKRRAAAAEPEAATRARQAAREYI